MVGEIISECRATSVGIRSDILLLGEALHPPQLGGHGRRVSDMGPRQGGGEPHRAAKHRTPRQHGHPSFVLKAVRGLAKRCPSPPRKRGPEPAPGLNRGKPLEALGLWILAFAGLTSNLQTGIHFSVHKSGTEAPVDAVTARHVRQNLLWGPDRGNARLLPT